MDKRRIDVIKQNEISQLYAFRLGSFEQKVLIEGRKADLPIVLSLHRSEERRVGKECRQ